MDARSGAESTATHLAALVEAARLISSSLTLDGVLDALRARAGALLGADAASIGFVAPNGRDVAPGALSPADRSGWPNELGDRPPPDRFVADAVARGRAAFAPDLKRDVSDGADVGTASTPAGCSLVAPLVADGETLGLLLMRWSRPVALDDAQIAIVEALASHAGVAIRNARLRTAAVEAARLEGTVKTAHAVAHRLNDDLTRVIAAAELLQLELDGQARCIGLLSSIVDAGEEAVRFVARLRQALRAVEQPTPIPPARDRDRAVDVEASG